MRTRECGKGGDFLRDLKSRIIIGELKGVCANVRAFFSFTFFITRRSRLFPPCIAGTADHTKDMTLGTGCTTQYPTSFYGALPACTRRLALTSVYRTHSIWNMKHANWGETGKTGNKAGNRRQMNEEQDCSGVCTCLFQLPDVSSTTSRIVKGIL